MILVKRKEGKTGLLEEHVIHERVREREKREREREREREKREREHPNMLVNNCFYHVVKDML
jgi:hypothetical protein